MQSLSSTLLDGKIITNVSWLISNISLNVYYVSENDTGSCSYRAVSIYPNALTPVQPC